MKVIFEGKIDAAKISYSGKIEDSKLKIGVEVDMAALVDEGAAKLPQSPLEQLVVGLAKQGLASL